MQKIIVFGKRKPGMSREDFIKYYETKHAVFGEKHLGGILVKFRRYYPTQVAHLPKDWKQLEPMAGTEPPYDVVTIYSFRDEQAFAEYEKIWADPEVRREFLNDELNLFDRDATIAGFCDWYEGEGIANT